MIDILLSTYNGERYLSEQLASILAQDYADWHLYVRDDGSQDNTHAILQEYVGRYPQQITLLPNDDENLGSMRSFEKLLQTCGNDEYIMFADQDDVWLPNKISRTLAVMQQTEREHVGKPIVVHCDLKVVDDNLHEIAPSFWQYIAINPLITDENVHFLAIGNTATGCAMMLNQQARKASLPFHKNAYMHDAWIGVKTLLEGGKVVPLAESLILYRQHGRNVCGAEKYHFSFLGWKEKYKYAQRAYVSSYPLVFNNVLSFLYWKIRCFIAIRL